MKAYVCVVGRTGAGKETVYKMITEEFAGVFSLCIHRFSDPLNEILDLLGLPRERENQQGLSTDLRKRFGEELLGNILHSRALSSATNVVFIDGVRRPKDVVMLRKLTNNFLISVSASPEKCYDRLKQRADRPGDAEKTWEQFLKEQAAEAESMIDELAKEADFKIDNSGTTEELRLQVKSFIREKLEPIYNKEAY